MITLGALQQMIPVILGDQIETKRPRSVVYGILVCGIVLQTSGFYVWQPMMIAFGGGLNALGIALFTLPYVRPLLSRVKHDMTALFIATALFYLHVAVWVGIALATQLQSVWSPALFVYGLALHIVLGGFGWFTLIIVGVSYKLLPMFTTATAPTNQHIWRVYAWLHAGLALLIIFILAGSSFGVMAGFIVTCIGLCFYAVDIKRVLARRVRRSVIPGMQLSVASIFYLFVSLILCVVVFILSYTNQFAFAADTIVRLYTAIGIVFAFGWVGAMIFGMLSRIVPMLIWLDIYADRVGQPDVPTLQQMIQESVLHKGNIVYQVGLILLTVAVSFGLSQTAYITAFMLCAGIVTIIGTLARVWLVHREGRQHGA